jgi:hypothetical protein
VYGLTTGPGEPMISQLEHPALQRSPGGLPGAGGEFASHEDSGSVRLDQLESVEGFSVEWQLLESAPGGIDGSGSPRAAGGQTA